MRLLLTIVLFHLALFDIFAEAKKLTAPRVTCNGNICIRILGKSGKFSVSRRGYENDEESNKTITIEFDSIKEVDASGNEVGKSGPKAGKHSFNSFAPLDFDFTDVENTTYKGIKAKGFNFSATIPGPNATLNVPVYIFSENGTLQLCDDEEIDVRRGMMKYNIELYNWNFCKNGSGCGNRNKEEIGDGVDFVITVKNKGKSVKGAKKKKAAGKRRKAQKFFFGRNSISFPSAVNADGSCIEMPDKYPELKPKGSNKYSVIFRFKTFNDKVIYDPAVNAEGIEDPPTTTPTTSPPPTPTTDGLKLLPSFGVVMILGVFTRLFF